MIHYNHIEISLILIRGTQPYQVDTCHLQPLPKGQETIQLCGFYPGSVYRSGYQIKNEWWNSTIWFGDLMDTRRLDQNDWCETLIFYDHSSRHYSPQRLEIEDIRRLLSSSLVMFILFGYLHLVYL
jgi:hypothetical protein